MASTSRSDTNQSLTGTAALGEHGGPGRSPDSWFLSRLDGFLSEPLRRAPPSELIRYRVLVGAALLLLVLSLLFLLTPLSWVMRVAIAFSAAGLLATLVLIRRSTSPTLPAWLVCANLAQGLVVSVFAHDMPLGGIHAAAMLLPALAVYLMGARMGLILTLLLALVLGVLHPLYYLPSLNGGPLLLPYQYLWPVHLFAALSFLGGWGLSALHGTARDAAQSSLERTLMELRDSEGKLISLLESTEDPIASLDLQGRVLTANSAVKRMYLQRFGVPLELGMPFFAAAEPEMMAVWQPRLGQVLAGQRLRFEEVHSLGDTRVTLDVCVSPIIGQGGQVVGMTLFGRDITARKEAEARLGEVHRTLVDVSRQAGMAEVATGVLHNVGNTLNSVNISTSLLADQLRQSRVGSLAKAAQLLREHSADIGTFLSQDEQGQKLPGFLVALSQHLVEEREAMSREVLALSESVDHIKSIVSMQQKHARTGGTTEQLSVPQLIDEALRLHAVSFERLGITIERDYAAVPPVLVDRHKLLQILINLLSNARHALVDSGKQDKRLIIRIRRSDDEQRLLIDVQDTGEGVATEHMPRLFTQGFTTKKTGHGFGLHISALAATEMKGRLSCTSPGVGQGATFTLELPMADEEASS
jgi:PAS domain S-box-containing protein